MGLYALYVLLLNPSNYTLFLHWNTFQFNGFGSHLMLFTMKLRYFRSSYKFGHDITSLLLYIEELSFVIHFKNKFLLFVNVLLDDPFHCIFLSSIFFGFVDSVSAFWLNFMCGYQGLSLTKPIHDLWSRKHSCHMLTQLYLSLNEMFYSFLVEHYSKITLIKV